MAGKTVQKLHLDFPVHFVSHHRRTSGLPCRSLYAVTYLRTTQHKFIFKNIKFLCRLNMAASIRVFSRLCPRRFRCLQFANYVGMLI